MSDPRTWHAEHVPVAELPKALDRWQSRGWQIERLIEPSAWPGHVMLVASAPAGKPKP